MMMDFKFMKSLNYVDFVGTVNQTNVPPGSLVTINEWLRNSDICPDSKILEIACSTGFNLRELTHRSGAGGIGIDISEPSILTARRNQKLLNNLEVEYIHGDAYEYSFKTNFTHIVAGAALGFFDDKPKIIKRVVSLLLDRGHLLVSPFYVHSTIPEKLLMEAKKVLGIFPTQIEYKDVTKVYEGFSLIHESRKNIIPSSPDEIRHYCSSTIDRFSEENPEISGECIEVAYNRMLEIRNITNELRKYQSYSVMVFELDKNTYPRRFVEVF